MIQVPINCGVAIGMGDVNRPAKTTELDFQS